MKFKKSKFDKDNDISKTKNCEFDIPLVNAKFGDNGIMYYGRSSDFETEKMTIDIVNDGAISTGSVYPQPQETGVLYNAYLIKSKFPISIQRLYFFSATIQKSIKEKFGYENKAGWEKVKKEFIQLPTKDGEIDFEFMDAYISELEEERISELSAYLTVSGLDNYELSREEKEILEKFDLLVDNWNLFKIQDVFDVKSSKKRFDANKIEILNHGFPYIVRMSTNNGIKGYLNQDEQLLNQGNTIAFGQDTATIFYQENPYFTGDKIKILECRYDKFNKINSMFFISAMRKSFSTFSWGANSFSEKVINNQEIKLPTKNNEIDFTYMELLISAVQKLVIKDVVLYADSKIEATKKAVNRN